MRRFAVLMALALAGCRGSTSERPPIHLNQNMDEQVRLDPQEAHPFFADRRGSRLPVEGTVPADSVAGPAYETGREGDAFVPGLPQGITLDRHLLERGRERYEIYCAPCHDVEGTGQGTVVARKMLPPPSFHDDRLRALPLGQLYDIVTHGIRNMPGYASQIPTEDRWAVAAYVRTLQRSRMATLDQVPTDVAAQKGWTQ